MNFCEVRPWNELPAKVVQLFCDASGDPGHIAAVFMSDDECLFTHMPVRAELMQLFRARNDKQIMGLELLSIALGVNSFSSVLRGTKVVIHSDNTGSEVRLDLFMLFECLLLCLRLRLDVGVRKDTTMRS